MKVNEDMTQATFYLVDTARSWLILRLMHGNSPFVRANEAKYLIAISDRNIAWGIATKEIEGKAFGTYSILPIHK
jgi:hypothetical protein